MARKNRANSGVIRRRTRRRLPITSGGISLATGPSVIATALAPSLSIVNDETSNSASSSNADLVNAHVNAIKQAQARVLLEQQKVFILF